MTYAEYRIQEYKYVGALDAKTSADAEKSMLELEEKMKKGARSIWENDFLSWRKEYLWYVC